MSDVADKARVEMVNIEVDGIAMEAPKNSMIIEATDRAGIDVPRFCYHRKLSIAANCRMCLVDVEKAPKPLPACATPVMEGMKIYTRSRRAVDAQHGVMEFLLINHPLDCPICDQGGECELQDLAMGYGRSVSRFTERKRVVKDKNVGPLIQTDMTRCIHCTRCVRFLEEIAGTSEMGGSGRGDRLEIGTCIEASIDSELSGNIIDVCPVGALTNKPFRFSARAWELEARPSVAGHDGVGSKLHYHHRLGKILRAVPADSESRNETWLSDRDRFSHFGLYAGDRVLEPRVKENGEWRTVSWAEGITAAAALLSGVREDHGPDQLGVLMSPSAASEEFFLAGRLVSGLGCANIDHRLRCQDFEASPLPPVFESTIAGLEQARSVLLVGSNIRHEAPLLGHRLRKAYLAGAQIGAVNPLDWDFHFELAVKDIAAPQHLLAALAGVASAVAEATGTELPADLAGLVSAADVTETHRELAAMLSRNEAGAVIVGQSAFAHPQAVGLRRLAAWIAGATNSHLNELPHGGNSHGAWLSGAVPAGGLNVREMLEDPRKAYLLWNFEPDFDVANPSLARQALAAADSLVAVTSFATTDLEEMADVILPLAPLAESEGTLYNLDGDPAEFSPAGRVSGSCKPGWKILRSLGGELELEGFDQVNLAQVREAMSEQAAAYEISGELPVLSATVSAEGFHRVGDLPMYGVDSLCRRSDALQQSVHAESGFAGLNPADAGTLGLDDGDLVMIDQGGEAIELPVQVSDAVPQGAVHLRSATCSTRVLGDSFGAMNIAVAKKGKGGEQN
jgi:NADH-quinone oxidoreductase subunit G